ncbi:WD repeat-containing protein 20 [Ischnura elegans]|uniref:WD repeat-containing protein 20 n=1 Tax=Ischnura elegans TaxID=197161 RepID=UPI001ED8A547|nr:WD repeat-containing protein 20 [Ischnura elegans]
MAVQVDGGGKDELKTQFITREGTYRLTPSDYSRPNRVGYTNTQGSTSVRVSFVTLPDPGGNGDRICFNFGRELYVYVYKGVKKAADLAKPLDKKVYKGTNPTCHDFNTTTMTADSVSLLVGFSTGQIQLFDPIKKELSKLFNEERLIDKTKVTCVRWVPGSPNLFLVSHGSGQLYFYNDELPCGTAPPHYTPVKQGDGYAIYTCKAKGGARNPIFRWAVGEGRVNEFAFSPCSAHLAIASQDGFLRVFRHDAMELLGCARSYFGGLTCVAWSPDGRYVAVGGEDDLVTVWSLRERRVVARGQGHRSWVSVVAFDPHTSTTVAVDGDESGGSEEDEPPPHRRPPDRPQRPNRPHRLRNHDHPSTPRSQGSDVSPVPGRSGRSAAGSSPPPSDYNRIACYRLGSVGQDTQLCLWDITEDILRQPPVTSSRSSGGSGSLTGSNRTQSRRSGGKNDRGARTPGDTAPSPSSSASASDGEVPSVGEVRPEPEPQTTATLHSLTQKLAALGFGSGDRRDRRRDRGTPGRGTSSRNSGPDSSSTSGVGSSTSDDPLRLIATPACPRFDQCPVLEPLVCKKIAHERLTALSFHEDCFVTACQDGYVYTWARPGKMVRTSSSGGAAVS